MKLAAKLVLSLLIGIALLLAVDGLLSVGTETALLEDDMSRDELIFGHALRSAVTEVWRVQGRQRALDLLADIDHREQAISVELVWLDDVGEELPADVLEALRTGRELSRRMTDRTGAGHHQTFVPLEPEPSRLAALIVSEPLSQLHNRTQRAVTRTLVLVGLSGLLSGAWVLSVGVALVGRPLRQLAAKVRRIGAGDLSGPLTLRGRDELSLLAAGLNHMCERLEASQDALRRESEARLAALEQLRQDDRLRTVGRLASEIAHEMGTPLNVVSGRAELIASGRLTADETSKSAHIIRAQAGRMTTIIRQILDFSRHRPPCREACDLHHLVGETVQLLSSLARPRHITLGLEPGEPVIAPVEPGPIQQVVSNLMVNAIEAVPDRGTVTLSVAWERARPPKRTGDRDKTYACIRVRDDGPGIAPEDTSHLFEPFFTTKAIGKGTGLGLSIAENIVAEHGGFIRVDSGPGSGSCFSVYLPSEAS